MKHLTKVQALILCRTASGPFSYLKLGRGKNRENNRITINPENPKDEITPKAFEEITHFELIQKIKILESEILKYTDIILENNKINNRLRNEIDEKLKQRTNFKNLISNLEGNNEKNNG